MLISKCFDTKAFLLQLLSVEQLVHKEWKLTDEGRKVAENGSHEAVVYNAVPSEGILQSDLIVCQYSFHIQLQITVITVYQV
jgi:phenylalanyl-tRNA synthetase alpha chain